MLSAYVPRGKSLERLTIEADGEIPEGAVWIDLVTPAPQEDKLVERHVGVAVPTREEMQEIEVSSRLYVENGARYMTATMMCQADTPTPKTTPVTFILAGHRLVTVRYDEPRPFTLISNKLARLCPATINGEGVMMELLDAVIDRLADILERIGGEVDQVSRDIFEGQRAPTGRGPTTKSSRASGAAATSPRKCARLWSRSDGCCCSWPTRRRACAGPRTRACSSSRCSATSCRCPITPPI